MGAYYPVGVYVGRVTRQSLGVSSQKQTPQFTVTFQITDALDQFGSSLGIEQQYERTVYLYLTEKAMEIALGALKVLGFNKTSLKFLDPETVGFVDFTGREVELYCKHEEYEGENRERWSINTPREQREVTPVDPMALRKLDALFGKGLKDLAAGKQPSTTANANKSLQQAAAEVGGEKDDIF